MGFTQLLGLEVESYHMNLMVIITCFHIVFIYQRVCVVFISLIAYVADIRVFVYIIHHSTEKNWGCSHKINGFYNCYI